MGKINQLSDNLINKIAAGEVVERPASVVKELIDNAIDAGATQINLELVDGGKTLIKITDNGEGMDKDDLLLSVLRHATSKIQTEEDLFTVMTKGFRGEALSSICAVSKLTIITKKEGREGYKLRLDNNKKEVEEIHAQTGTTIIIEDLFKNIPARHKFLKATSTELKHCIDTFTDLSLSNPNIGFNLDSDNKRKITLPKNQNLLDRIKILFGASIAENLLAVATDTPHLKVYGFIGKPEVASRTAEQFISVNNRPIFDKLVSAAVRDSYSNLIMPRLKATFFLYIDTPPDYVDVNIHPQKREVKFLNTNEIFSLVKNSVQSALNRSNLTYGSFNVKTNKNTYEPPKQINQNYTNQSFETELSFKPNTNYTKQSFTPNQNIEFLLRDNLTTNTHDFFVLNNLYIISATDNGFEIIDQHAAHERILYNKIKSNVESEKQKQSLLIAQELDIDKSLLEIFAQHKSAFENIGFEFDDLTITFKPTFIKSNIINYIKDVLTELSNGEDLQMLDSKSDRVLATMACKAAVKAGDNLSNEEVINLISSLEQEDDKYTCPHGRPLKVSLRFNDIDKLFKRII